MIDLMFNFGNEVILVRIDKTNIQFSNSVYSSRMTDINGLRLSKNGVIKEFPDLKDNVSWREEAIKRFKEHIKKMKNENEISQYIIFELSKYGYLPKFRQKKGFRIEKIKWHSLI